jgi:two-component system, NtrC family, sensor kinase
MAPLNGNQEPKKPIQEKKDRLSEEFLAELIHKLNNPLTAVLGYSQILLLKLTSPDNREDVEKILREAGRISGILRDLSAYIKKRDPKKQTIDINELVRKTVEARTRESGLPDIEVSTRVTPLIPFTQVDSVQIQSVLLNIIENAEQAVSEFQGRGKIRIETTVRKEDIEIIVSDNGPGIAQENISKIFNPLFTTKKNRMGLGLSISNEIVEAHGGKIEVKTEQGKGASFIITLPLISNFDEKDNGE